MVFSKSKKTRRTESSEVAAEFDYRRLVWEQTQDGIRITDAEGIILDVNQAYCALVGLLRDDLIGKSFSIVYAPDVRDTVIAEYKARFAEGTVRQGIERIIKLHDGTLLCCIFDESFLKGHAKHSALMTVVRDVSEIRRSERQTELQRQRYDDLARLLPQPVFETDAGDILTYMNPAAFVQFGFSDAEYRAGIAFASMLAQEDCRRVLETVHRTPVDTGGHAFECTAVRRDGSKFPALLFTSPVLEDGRMAGFRGIIADISQFRNTEQALLESESRFRSLIQYASDIVTILDTDGKVLYTSPATARILGYPEESLKDRTLLSLAHPGDNQTLMRMLVGVMTRSGGSAQAEFRLRRQDGTYLDVESIAVNMLEVPGVNGIVITTRDCTERNRALLQQRQLSLLIESSSEFFGIATIEGAVQYLNRAGRVLAGIASDAPVDRLNIRDFIPPEDHRWFDEVVGTQLRHAGFWKGEGRLIRFDDHMLVYVAINVFTIADPVTNKPYLLAAVMSDLSTHKGTEQTLKESEQRFSLFMQHLPAAVFIKDGAGRVVFCNDFLQDLFGWEHAIGKSTFDLLPYDVADRMVKDDLEAMEHPLVVRIETVTDRRGNERVFQTFKFPVPSGADQPLIGGISIEITDRVRGEEALRESESRFRMLTEHARDLITLQDIHGQFLYVSPSSAAVLGYAPEALTGRHLYDFLHTDDRGLMENSLRATISDAATAPVEYRFRKSDGTYAWLETIGRLIPPASSDQPVRVLAISRDTTERKHLDHALRRRQTMESLGVLAGGIAHDFNNLLQAIVGHAALAEQRLQRDHPAFASLQKLDAAARRASELTQQLLAYSGRGKFVIAPTLLNNLITENQHLFEATISRHITLEFALDASIPPVMADPGQLQQLIMNLILNSGEAIGDRAGTIRVTTSLLEITEETREAWARTEEIPRAGKYVLLEVSDNGEGMTEETLAKIFDPLFTTRVTGRGLGLPAVLGIVRSHHGGMQVASEPMKGTLMRVALPVSETLPAPVLEPGLQELETSGLVLVIDDDPMVVDLAVELLGMHRLKALAALNGEEGIALYQKNKKSISVVLLDLSMPGIGGEETFRRLKEINPDVRIILSSGYSETEAMEAFSDTGLSGFIQKPYRPNKLMEMLYKNM